MIDRRAFIQRSTSLVCAGLLARGNVRRSQSVLRVGTLIDARDHDLDAGISFGADEANRSAMLFGWGVRQIRMTSVPRDEMTVHALIIGAPADITKINMPVIALRCGLAPGAFVLAACEQVAVGSSTERTVLWHESLERFGAEQLNDRYRAATRTEMTGDAWLGWLAMKLLAESALRAKSVESHALIAWLESPQAQFDGHKGLPLRFDATRRLRQPSYIVRRDESSGRWSVVREIDPDAVAPRR